METKQKEPLKEQKPIDYEVPIWMRLLKEVYDEYSKPRDNKA